MVTHRGSAEQGVERHPEGGSGHAQIPLVEPPRVAEIAQFQGLAEQVTHGTRDLASATARNLQQLVSPPQQVGTHVW
jgi:hypothetical protein